MSSETFILILSTSRTGCAQYFPLLPLAFLTLAAFSKRSTFPKTRRKSNTMPARSIGFNLRAGGLWRLAERFLFYFCFEQSQMLANNQAYSYHFFVILSQASSVFSPLYLLPLSDPFLFTWCVYKSPMKSTNKFNEIGLTFLRFSFSAKLLTSLTSLKSLAVIFQNRIRMNILA